MPIGSKSVTIYKSVSIGKGVGTGHVIAPGIGQSVQQLFRTQYVVASAITSVRSEYLIPITITNMNRTIMFSLNSKYMLSGAQDSASTEWTGLRDSNARTEFVSESTCAFTRATALVASSSSIGGLGFIEYLGIVGGAHEIASRINFVATLTTGQDSISTTLDSVGNANKVVPFITSMMCDQAGTTPKSLYAYMSGTNDLNVVFRTTNSTTQARHAYINAVEFVGPSWNVRHCYMATSNAVSANANIMTAPLGAGVTAAVNWGQTMIIPMQSTQGSCLAQFQAQRPPSLFPIIIPGGNNSSAAIIYDGDKEASFSTASETLGYLITNAAMSVLRVDNTALGAGWKEINMSGNSPGSASACWAIMQAITSGSAFPHGCFTTLQISDTTVAFHNSTSPQTNSRHHLQVAKLPRN